MDPQQQEAATNDPSRTPEELIALVRAGKLQSVTFSMVDGVLDADIEDNPLVPFGIVPTDICRPLGYVEIEAQSGDNGAENAADLKRRYETRQRLGNLEVECSANRRPAEITMRWQFAGGVEPGDKLAIGPATATVTCVTTSMYQSGEFMTCYVDATEAEYKAIKAWFDASEEPRPGDPPATGE